jgi:hypothetical protein
VFLRQCSGFAPDDPEPVGTPPVLQAEFTARDEANALTAFAFRNGFIEEIHAGQPSPLLQQPGFSRISDDEMRRLMIEASEKLEQMLRLKRDAPDRYETMIRAYHMMYCQGWKRD